jgi:choline-sulfatase
LVFIIVDQHSGVALGCAGHPLVRTPRLDALAKQGTLFTHAYTAGVTCAPSRASMDTSLRVQRHGVRENGVPLGNEYPTLWTILEKNGYTLSGQQRGPTAQYLEWVSRLGYKDVASPIIGSKEKAQIIPTPYRYAVGRAGLSPEHTLDAWTVQRAMRFLDENKDRRFCLTVQLHGPHDPWVAPPPYDTMYRPSDLPLPPYRAGEYEFKPARQKRIWRETGADRLTDEQIRIILAHYYGLVTYSDMLVGKVLDQLAALGLNENTVVIYTADHGDMMGGHRMFTKGFAFYEPAIRIPLIIRAPSGGPPGRKVHGAVSNIDFLPTTLELLGLPPARGIEGRSLVPFWHGAAKGRAAVFGGEGFEGDDRLVMIRTTQWKLTRYDEGGGELYDLERDPNELDNLIANPKYAAVVRRLTRQLEHWDTEYPHAELRIAPQAERADPQRWARVRVAFKEWKKKPGNRVP